MQNITARFGGQSDLTVTSRDRSTIDFLTLDELIAAARRQAVTFLVCIVLGCVLGAGYLLFTTKLYSAATRILLSPVVVLPDEQVDSLTLTSRGLDETYVDSQVEVLKSENVVLAVARKLNLMEDPRVIETDDSFSLFGAIRSLFSFGSDEKDPAEVAFRLERAVVSAVRDNLWVERLDNTYVLQVLFQSEYPELSSLIANELAMAYIAEQTEARYAAARRAVVELTALLERSRAEATSANLALERFRQEHDLVTAGDTVLQELQLIEINRTLMDAVALRTAAEARVNRIKTMVSGGPVNTMGLETIDNPIINDFRARYLQFAAQHERALEEFGTDHPQTKQLQKEMTRVRAIIDQEFARVVESYELDYEVAVSQETMVRKEFDESKLAVSQRKAHQEKLEELRSEAEMYRTLYESMLRRHQFALQQEQSIPVSEARIISEATRPLRPFHPKRSVVLAVSLLIGASLGVAVALLRERELI